MPLFLHQWSYKDQQIKRMLVDQVDRAEVVRVAIEAFGGNLISFYYCLGPFDGIAISEFHDPESALACAMTIFGQGRLDDLQTTPLYTADEGLRAMQRAAMLVKGPAA